MRHVSLIAALIAGLFVILATASFTAVSPHQPSAAARPPAYRSVSGLPDRVAEADPRNTTSTAVILAAGKKR